jgi:hypothetical protein
MAQAANQSIDVFARARVHTADLHPPHKQAGSNSPWCINREVLCCFMVMQEISEGWPPFVHNPSPTAFGDICVVRDIQGGECDREQF